MPLTTACGTGGRWKGVTADLCPNRTPESEKRYRWLFSLNADVLGGWFFDMVLDKQA